MIIDQYSAAIFPDRYRVLGKVLLPLTIGHGLLLARLGNPFAPWSGQGMAGAGDIITAATVCSMHHDDAFDSISTSRFARRARRLAWFACHFHSTAARLKRAAVLLSAYVQEACRGPRVWVKGDAEKSKVPVLATLKTGMQELFHASHDEALETPVAVALYELTVYSDRHGSLDFMSDEEAEMLGRLNKPAMS